MVKIKRAIFGIAATAAIVLLPMAPAMAGGQGFRPLHPFGRAWTVWRGRCACYLAAGDRLQCGIWGWRIRRAVSLCRIRRSRGSQLRAPDCLRVRARTTRRILGTISARRSTRLWAARLCCAPHPGYYGRGYYR